MEWRAAKSHRGAGARRAELRSTGLVPARVTGSNVFGSEVTPLVRAQLPRRVCAAAGAPSASCRTPCGQCTSRLSIIAAVTTVHGACHQRRARPRARGRAADGAARSAFHAQRLLEAQALQKRVRAAALAQLQLVRVLHDGEHADGALRGPHSGNGIVPSKR